jgi:hypothetical protein
MIQTLDDNLMEQINNMEEEEGISAKEFFRLGK